MKVWILYYKGKLDNTILENYDPTVKDQDPETRIYAITSSKELLKSFLTYRNRDLFKVRKLDIMAAEYEQLASEHRGAILDDYYLSTSNNKSVQMPMTDFEYRTACDDYVIDSILTDSGYWKDTLSADKFNNKIKKALYTLGYIQFRKLAVQTSLDEYDDYDAPDISVDELQQFITNFGKTLAS